MTENARRGVATLIDERISAGKWTPPWVRYSHLARYEWVARLASGKRVVDAACGTGYGSHELVRAGAGAVLGFDVSNDAIAAASADFASDVASFALADVAELPVADASIDLYVSFETIEHVDDVDAFLSEVRRVLRPGGIFACSTPNREVTNPGTAIGDRPYNPYHLREYDPAELRALAGRYFIVEELLGQSFANARYVDALRRIGGLQPRAAVRIHQAAKVLRIPFDRKRAHELAAFDVRGERPEALVVLCRKAP